VIGGSRKGVWPYVGVLLIEFLGHIVCIVLVIVASLALFVLLLYSCATVS